jgi:hypothetical protein
LIDANKFGNFSRFIQFYPPCFEISWLQPVEFSPIFVSQNQNRKPMSNTSDRTAILASIPPELGHYVSQAPEGDLATVLESQILTVQNFFSGLTEAQQLHRYAPGKWSPRQILGHLSDSERVFQYRALRFARADSTDLPGFEESDWALSSNAHDRPMPELIQEFKSVRMATVSLVKSFTDEMLWRTGTANGKSASVIGMLLGNAGHAEHHIRVIRERYL